MMILLLFVLVLIDLLFLICLIHDVIAWAMKPLATLLLVVVLSGWTGIPISKFYERARR